MEEQLISFETAKLAKEKGFNEYSTHLYTIGFGSIKEDKIVRKHGNYEENDKLLQPIKLGNTQPHLALAPTQSLLQKWLREVYDINVTILICGFDYHSFILHDKNRKYIKTVDNPTTYENHKNNYEDTLDKGLQEALKLIPQS